MNGTPAEFRVLDALTAPGNEAKPNDDAWCAAARLAAVIDGATGLGGKLLPGESDAAWLAHRTAKLLVDHAGLGEAPAVLAATVGDLEDAFKRERYRAPAENYEMPFASLMLVEPVAVGKLRALWFGDCCAILRRTDGSLEIIGEAFEKRSDEARSAARLALGSASGPAARNNRPEFLAELRAQRNRYNSDDGVWILAPDRRCAAKARSNTLLAPPGTVVLLATDGFLVLASDYQQYEPSQLVKEAEDRGLAALLTELRAIEADDPGGKKYPRFKTSDDATAVLLRIT